MFVYVSAWAIWRFKKQMSCKNVNILGRILPLPFFVIRLHCYYPRGESPEHFHSHWAPRWNKNRPQSLGFELCGLTSAYTVTWLTRGRGSLLRLARLLWISQNSSAKFVGALHVSWINTDPPKQILWSLFHPRVTLEVQNNGSIRKIHSICYCWLGWILIDNKMLWGASLNIVT